jgi:hypothetical protein
MPVCRSPGGHTPPVEEGRCRIRESVSDNIESTAPVSCNRIALYPCACAPDAFRAGRRSGRSRLLSWHRGTGCTNFGGIDYRLSWALRMRYSLSDIPECPRNVIGPGQSTRVQFLAVPIGATYMHAQLLIQFLKESGHTHEIQNDTPQMGLCLHRIAHQRGGGPEDQDLVPTSRPQTQLGRHAQDVAHQALR